MADLCRRRIRQKRIITHGRGSRFIVRAQMNTHSGTLAPTHVWRRALYSASLFSLLPLLAPTVYGEDAPTLLAPQSVESARPVQPSPATAKIVDVILDQGELTGYFADSQGEPIDGATVTILQQGQPVASAQTDKSGKFRVPNLKPGSYAVRMGSEIRQIRIWSPNSAPPQALQGLPVTTDSAVRGQGELAGLGGLNGGLGGGGLGLGGGGLGLGGGLGSLGGGLGMMGGGLGSLGTLGAVAAAGTLTGGAVYGVNSIVKAQNKKKTP